MPLADEVTPEFENGELAWDRCKKCHAQQVFLRGIVKGRTIFCPSCHKKRIARHVEWFEELRDRYLSHAHDSET
jgi:NAD-dependent SIR2 family protein deacetylase